MQLIWRSDFAFRAVNFMRYKRRGDAAIWQRGDARRGDARRGDARRDDAIHLDLRSNEFHEIRVRTSTRTEFLLR